jgi:hypothetical protein
VSEKGLLEGIVLLKTEKVKGKEIEREREREIKIPQVNSRFVNHKENFYCNRIKDHHNVRQAGHVLCAYNISHTCAMETRKKSCSLRT